MRLQPAPDSIGTARSAVRDTVARWGLVHLADTGALLVSELSTNAVLHAGTDFEVQVERLPGRVRVSVLDGSPHHAVRRRYGLQAGTGRGLGLVETLAADWGCRSVRGGPWAKEVWFELAEAAGDQASPPEGALYGEDWLALVDDL